MKIAIDISQIVYEGTGVANYTNEMVRNLLKIDRENEYLLFGMSLRQKDKLDSFFENVKSLNNKTQFKFLPIPQTLSNLIWNKFHIVDVRSFLGDFDILHSSDWIQPPTTARKVTTVHDLVIYKYPQFSHSNIIATQKKRLYWVKRECDAIIADSVATKSDLISILKVDQVKIEVVYPGIGVEFRHQNDEEIIRVKQKYGLYDNYILSVGTVEPRKNLSAVFAAFTKFLQHSLVASKKTPIGLVVAGKVGWGEELKPTKSVNLLGQIAQRDLPALYSGALFFVYPSFYEGFGLPVLEAMACGCPVITSDRGSLKEVASDAALLVDPGDTDDLTIKMTQLYIDCDLRGELVEKGKKNTEKFSWQKSAEEIIRIYKKLDTL